MYPDPSLCKRMIYCKLGRQMRQDLRFRNISWGSMIYLNVWYHFFIWPSGSQQTLLVWLRLFLCIVGRFWMFLKSLQHLFDPRTTFYTSRELWKLDGYHSKNSVIPSEFSEFARSGKSWQRVKNLLETLRKCSETSYYALEKSQVHQKCLLGLRRSDEKVIPNVEIYQSRFLNLRSCLKWDDIWSWTVCSWSLKIWKWIMSK